MRRDVLLISIINRMTISVRPGEMDHFSCWSCLALTERDDDSIRIKYFQLINTERISPSWKYMAHFWDFDTRSCRRFKMKNSLEDFHNFHFHSLKQFYICDETFSRHSCKQASVIRVSNKQSRKILQMSSFCVASRNSSSCSRLWKHEN